MELVRLGVDDLVVWRRIVEIVGLREICVR
jgi:hypothetical protein